MSVVLARIIMTENSTTFSTSTSGYERDHELELDLLNESQRMRARYSKIWDCKNNVSVTII